MSVDQATAFKVFLSYAQDDIALVKEFVKHLTTLREQGLMTLWYDQYLEPGQDRAKEITHHLHAASIILLCTSSSFLASQSHARSELMQALERQKSKEVRVIPVLLRSCVLTNAQLERLQPLPSNERPITSWAQHDDAFVDVVKGLQRVLEDLQKQQAQESSSPVLVENLPYERNILFTGRQELLDRLHTAFHQENGSSHTYAITGLGGIGKTQTALEYAYRYQHEYETMLWVNADSEEQLLKDMNSIAHLLALSEREKQDQSLIVNAVKRWLQQPQRWLLILDNADDFSIVTKLLPLKATGHILITTRSHTTGRIAQAIEIDHMDLKEGALFLLRRAKQLGLDDPLEHASIENQRLAQEITQLMGGLPLALDQAGAYIEETQCGLKQYLSLYRQRQSALLQHRGKHSVDHHDPVATTWSLSFEKVQQANASAVQLLSLCAFLDPDSIPEALLTEGVSGLGPEFQALAEDPLVFNEAIAELLTYSLIQRNPDQTITMHRLVQTVLRNQMTQQVQRVWIERAIQAVKTLYPDADHTNQQLCLQYLPHAQQCAFLIEHWQIASPEAAHLLDAAGRYLRYAVQYKEAEPLLQRALIIREKMLGPDHPDTATTLDNLAGLYRAQGRFEQAEPLLQRALVIREKMLGPDHPSTAATLDNLALLYQARGRFEQAEPLFQRALVIREKMLGPDHPDTATTLNNLAGLYRAQGRSEEAEPLFQRALTISKKMLGPDHPSTAATLNNLALLYQEQGRYEKAEPLFQQALAISEKVLGPEHPDTAATLNNLALLYRTQGRFEQAEPLFQQDLAISEKVLGPEHPDTATTLNNLALLYQARGRFEQAELLFQRALAIREKVLGPDHPSTATTLDNLAGLYRAQGRFEQAEPLFQRALTISEKVLGPDHPSTAATLNNLAGLYRVQRRYEEAEPLFQRALTISEKVLGPDHPSTAATLNNLALLYQAQVRYEEAEPLFRRALAIREKVLGLKHPSTVTTLNNLALLYQAQGRSEEMKHLLKKEDLLS